MEMHGILRTVADDFESKIEVLENNPRKNKYDNERLLIYKEALELCETHADKEALKILKEDFIILSKNAPHEKLKIITLLECLLTIENFITKKDEPLLFYQVLDDELSPFNSEDDYDGTNCEDIYPSAAETLEAYKSEFPEKDWGIYAWISDNGCPMRKYIVRIE